MKKILIITHSRDNPCIDTVSAALRRQGGSVFRLNTDQYPGTVSMSWEQQPGQARMLIETPEGALDLSQVSAVWYRRVQIGKELSARMAGSPLRGPAIEESRRSFLGMLMTINTFVLDPWICIRHAEVKQLQLQKARQLGLDVPATLVSNSPRQVQQWHGALPERDIITKMQASFAIYEQGEEKVVFTNKISDTADLQGLELCPMMFQQYIAKQLELRISIVGSRLFCAAIDSQQSARAAHDWRKDGLALANRWQPYELPAEVSHQLMALMDFYRLNYAAIDMILTPDQRHVFIELNPAGEFFWLDPVFDYGISEALADVLLGRCERRSHPFF